MSKFLYSGGARSYGTPSNTYYVNMAGGSSGVAPASEAVVKARVRDSYTWSNLFARVNANAQTSACTVKTRVNGADGAQSLSITAGVTGDFEDTTHTDSLADGDQVNLGVTTGTGGAITIDSISTLLTHAGDVAMHVAAASSGTTVLANSSSYVPLHGPRVGNATEVNAQVTCREATTLSRLGAYVSANNNPTNAATIRIRVNGANGNQSISVSASATGEFEDTSNSDSIAAGDEVNYAIVTGTGGSMAVSVLQCESSSGLMASTPIGTAFTGTASYYPIGAVANSTTDEARTKVPARTTAIRFAKLCFSTSTNTRSVSTTVALRKNGSAAISLSVAASTTGLFEDTASEVTPGAVSDDFNFAVSSAAGSGSLTMGTVSIGQLPLSTVTVAGATAGAPAAALAGAVQIARAVPGEKAAAVAAANPGTLAAVQIATIAGATATAAAAAGAGAVQTFPAAIVVGVTATAAAAARAGTVAAVGIVAVAGATATAPAAAGAGSVKVTSQVSGETAAAAAAALLAVITALRLGHPHPPLPAPSVGIDHRLSAPRVHARRSGSV